MKKKIHNAIKTMSKVALLGKKKKKEANELIKKNALFTFRQNHHVSPNLAKWIGIELTITY